MDPLLEDLPLITEETFDFEPCSPPDSVGEDDIVPLVNSSSSSRLVGHHRDTNVPSTEEGSLLQHWSPLSAQGMEEITKEANRLAKELEKENMSQHWLDTLNRSSAEDKSSCERQIKPVNVLLVHQTDTPSTQANLGNISNPVPLMKDSTIPNFQLGSPVVSLSVCNTSAGPQALLLSQSTKSVRSPRRETYVIKDSPNRSHLPNVSTPPNDVPCSNLSHEKRRGNGSQEKGKRFKGSAVNTYVSKGSPRRHNSVVSCSGRSPAVNPIAGKYTVPHVRAPHRSSGISTPNSRLPVPKPSGNNVTGNPKQTEPRVLIGLVRPSTQKGSYLRPPSHIATSIKTSLPRPPRRDQEIVFSL
ncbi:proline/serine-rich coiled-coil protein 1 [Pelodytes ibericus]